SCAVGCCGSAKSACGGKCCCPEGTKCDGECTPENCTCTKKPGKGCCAKECCGGKCCCPEGTKCDGECTPENCTCTKKPGKGCAVKHCPVMGPCARMCGCMGAMIGCVLDQPCMSVAISTCLRTMAEGKTCSPVTCPEQLP